MCEMTKKLGLALLVANPNFNPYLP